MSPVLSFFRMRPSSILILWVPDTVYKLGRFSPPYRGDPWKMERDILDDTPIFISVVQSAGDWILSHWASMSVLTPKGCYRLAIMPCLKLMRASYALRLPLFTRLLHSCDLGRSFLYWGIWIQWEWILFQGLLVLL